MYHNNAWWQKYWKLGEAGWVDRWGNLYTFCPIFSINRKLLKKPMDFFKVHILRLHLYKILEHQNTLYDSTGSMVTKDEEEEKSVQSLSQVRLFVNPWTAARQASLSITNSWRLLKLLEMVQDREAWHAAVHVVAKSWTRLSDWTNRNF